MPSKLAFPRHPNHMTSSPLQLHLGVKADPIEYRYTYEWLFRILSEEGIEHVQIGTFFEIYQLPDDFFFDLKRKADDFGIRISSIFTAHRELGGFFRFEPGFVGVAMRNFKRLIEVGGLLGAWSVGSNPGAVMRDQMGLKTKATRCYIDHAKDLLLYAHQKGVAALGIEPMSCLAEPPTLPHEIVEIAEELMEFHRANIANASRPGYCADISHGYADKDRKIVWDHYQLLEAALPYTTELHLKNTDAFYNSTFGFTSAQREKGIIDIPSLRDWLHANAARLPFSEMIGYLEIGGPKTGRDYSDGHLEEELRESLQYLKGAFLGEPSGQSGEAISVEVKPPQVLPETAGQVLISPSMMCADLCHLEADMRKLEAIGVEMLHMDIMDAHFVPNMPLGLETLRHLRPKTHLPFDVHLMVENNDFFVQEIAKIGAELVSVHAESSIHLDRTLSLIRDYGIKAGVALNPATPLDALDYVLDKVDFVLLMTVNPGYAGQKLVEATLAKIAECRAMLDRNGRFVPIQVDGNVSFEHIPRMTAAGSDILVAGTSSLFHRDGSLRENYEKTRAAIGKGLAMRSLS